MHVYHPHSVDNALYHGLRYLRDQGFHKESRVGPTLACAVPFTTIWGRNVPRVSIDEDRDANPFFHLFEAVWMMAGRNDVAFVSRFNPRMATFSEDGDTQHGAYGFRWREWFSFDQLKELKDLLTRDPMTRRAVLTMWSPSGDLVSSEGYGGLSAPDVPCNTQVYFRTVRGHLDMTVMARSNDMVWGAYGANVVHFSLLHFYMAAATGLPVGLMYQMSNDMHVYTDRPDVQKLLSVATKSATAWQISGSGMPDRQACGDFLRACDLFCEYRDDEAASASPFFNDVVVPMFKAWVAYKNEDLAVAVDYLSKPDLILQPWGYAAHAWMKRRQAKRAAQGAQS